LLLNGHDMSEVRLLFCSIMWL